MTSLLRSYSQIVKSSEFLFVPTYSNHGGFTISQLQAQAVNSASNVIRFDGTVLNVKNYANFVNGIAQTGINVINAGEVYRDLGKVLHIFENGVKMATFRYAQKVDDANAGAEGVGGQPNLYMCTWQAAGGSCPSAYAMVKVVRAG